MTNEDIRIIEDEKRRIYPEFVTSEFEIMVFNDMVKQNEWDPVKYWAERLD